MPSTKPRTLFITVGTTQFDHLLEAIDTQQFIDTITLYHHISHITIQTGGTGTYKLHYITQPQIAQRHNYTIDAFTVQPNIQRHFTTADMIITHAGAGSIIDSFRYSTNAMVLVVTNDKLMNNHQLEVAQALAERHFVYMCTRLPHLVDTVKAMQPGVMQKYPTAETGVLTQVVHGDLVYAPQQSGVILGLVMFVIMYTQHISLFYYPLIMSLVMCGAHWRQQQAARQRRGVGVAGVQRQQMAEPIKMAHTPYSNPSVTDTPPDVNAALEGEYLQDKAVKQQMTADSRKLANGHANGAHEQRRKSTRSSRQSGDVSLEQLLSEASAMPAARTRATAASR